MIRLRIILICIGAVISFIAVTLLFNNKEEALLEDMYNLSTYIVSIYRGEDYTVKESEKINTNVFDYIKSYEDNVKVDYPDYINMTVLNKIYEDTNGRVNSESVEYTGEEIELTEEELKSILGDDYKERIESEKTYTRPDDTRIEISPDGDAVVYYDKLKFNEQGEEYLTYKGLTHLIVEDALDKSYKDMIGKQDYNFIFSTSSLYEDKNKKYYDMLFTSITNKNKLSIRFYIRDKKISEMDVTLIEG